MTNKKLKVYFYASGWDPREDTVKPGETSDEWLHLDEGDILEIRETEERNRN